jgi:hypothetical protein
MTLELKNAARTRLALSPTTKIRSSESKRVQDKRAETKAAAEKEEANWQASQANSRLNYPGGVKSGLFPKGTPPPPKQRGPSYRRSPKGSPRAT